MHHIQQLYGTRVRSVVWLSALFVAGASGWACSSSSPDAGFTTGASPGAGTGSNASGGTTGSTGNPSGNGGIGSASAGAGTTAGSIGVATTACDNGKDDDGDGLIDGFDPECTGPLDNDEGTFATGIPGDNKDPKWQDCFFDGNSGAGDDGCRYSTQCLTGELSQDDPDCSVTDSCVNFCAQLTQNGCDCFGCCTVQLPDGSRLDVVEAATCSVATVGDEKSCPRCTKSTQCGNECGECELCAGKTLADLPARCSPPTGTGGAPSTGGAGGAGSGGAPSTGGVTNSCDGGEAICGPGHAPCPSDRYCSFGCCIIAIR
jgi:hypothetical protein